MKPSIHAHVFTDISKEHFLKQAPGNADSIGNVNFTFGVEIDDTCDVLIVFNRSSFTLKTSLPKARTVFLAAEPDVIHPYSARFLNQFGLVLTTSDKPLQTQKWKRATCWYWFAGMDFSHKRETRGYDWFSNLEMPAKSDKISIVTSTKVYTEYHRKRLTFIETLADTIPEHLALFGRGFKSVDDKADAILPYKYHLAIENGFGPDLWTEKLADPYLCGAFPFYAGCTNTASYFPDESFNIIDLDHPKDEARRMVEEIANGRWAAAQDALNEARRRVLEQHNLMQLLYELAISAGASELPRTRSTTRYIWSEKSLLPESGSRGTLPDWFFRNLLLKIDPQLELKTVRLRHWLDSRRSAKRSKKAKIAEAQMRAGTEE
tara:strand:+ start:283 stop:1413 length:1131 start_codon:yes stop_codon:yes gene_type:complete